MHTALEAIAVYFAASTTIVLVMMAVVASSARNVKFTTFGGKQVKAPLMILIVMIMLSLGIVVAITLWPLTWLTGRKGFFRSEDGGRTYSLRLDLEGLKSK